MSDDLTVKRRHPRLAVWRFRAMEFSPMLACAVAGVVSVLLGHWGSAIAWFVGVVVLLTYQWRAKWAWEEGWRRGREDALGRVLQLIPLEAVDVQGLQEVYMAEAPAWREVQNRLALIDDRATTSLRGPGRKGG